MRGLWHVPNLASLSDYGCWIWSNLPPKWVQDPPFVCQDVPVAIHPWVKRHYIVEMRTAPTRCSRNQPTNVWIWMFFSILASFQTDFFFAGGTINTSTTSAAFQGVLAPLGSLYCQQIVSQETWWRTRILWVYASVWDCEGTFVRCLGNDAWKASWFNQEDFWRDIYLGRIRTSDLPLSSQAVLQKKRLCVFFVCFSCLDSPFKVHRFGHRTTGFGVKSTWCSLGTFQQMPTSQQEIWPLPSLPWEFQNGHERLGFWWRKKFGAFWRLSWGFCRSWLELGALQCFKNSEIDGMGTSCGLRRSCLWRERLLFTFTYNSYIYLYLKFPYTNTL